MNIPGITDVTSEEMADMTLEQLEELRDLADSHAKEFQMQLEALEIAGGVSATHAAQFKSILPPQVILESFTSQVTHTNLKISTEALSTAVKVALVVGAVAALGGLVFLFMRMNGRSNKEVNESAVGTVEKMRDTARLAEKLAADPTASKGTSANQQDKTDKTSLEILKKFIAEGDLLHIRTSLRMPLTTHDVSEEGMDNMVAAAESARKDLWEPYEEKAFARGLIAEKSMWDDEYAGLQVVYLKTNFSKERFTHIRQVINYLKYDKRGDDLAKKILERTATAAKRKADEKFMEDNKESLDSYTFMALSRMATNKGDLTGSKMVGTVWGKLDFNFDADFKELLVPAVAAAVKFSKSGDEKDLAPVENIKTRRPIEKSRKTFNAIAETVRGELRDARKLDLPADDVPAAIASLKSLMETPATLGPNGILFIRGWLNTGEYKVVPPNYTTPLKKIDELLKIGEDIAKQEQILKDLEGVPKEVSEVLKEYVALTKENLQIVDFVSTLINMDITLFNRMMTFANQSSKASIQASVDSLNEVINDKGVSESMKAACRSAVEEIKKGVSGMK